MGLYDTIKAYAKKGKKKPEKKPADEPRKPEMDESDNPTGAEAGTSFARMLMNKKKK